ncbi:D-isomer specific 2-hydroxyacid dehydrogenase [Epithele typhae]|uniref:D-isomer specific 2-hydroxyacid dehydrogenase n=1 Tax=Epithele typhae TaxID=378194 RepID=UPI0020074CCE|nr:D-isomer specific 2-hydroxyacid dehydrogenase [Epithele typhae]KAH9944140.1 D-isomer specific 2-hydroxyacid dehydrogenase [Epithele typhae]
MGVPSQSSAAGVLALLSDPEPLLKQYALKALNQLVPQFWAEISEHIALIESLYEGEGLPQEAHDSAALLASKVYYYLGEYDEALSFALGAGSAFVADSRNPGAGEYVETVVSKAIDRYISSRNAEQSEGRIDPRLQGIIEGIFGRCIEDGEYRQAIGIALESRRLDIIKSIYEQTRDTTLLSYAMEAVLDTAFPLAYRDQVLKFLFPLFPAPTGDAKTAHVYALTRILVTLNSPEMTINFFTSLVPAQKLLAYQFAFDLVEGGGQDFLEVVRKDLPEGDEATKPIYDQLRKILLGQESIKLYLEFLKRNNKVDMLILKNTKDALEPRSSIYHSALTLQNAFMHAGTTSDVFLRENLEWLALANNWSKFSAAAAIGVIHKGHFQESMAILGPYLPAQGAESSTGSAAYSEGGALYALGLVNAGCGSGQEVEAYLRTLIKSTNSEVVQHGAALGLGVAGMGGKSAEAYDDLKQTLFSDSAVAGEAAGYAMGLIMLGTADATSADEMLTYARETQHEKIIRGLAVGLALIFYGRQEEADEMVKMLMAEKDPILRYGGVYTLALAYAGTSNNAAIRQLLHVAVSDTSDDVRRAAVTSLAFLLFKNPAQVPRIVQLLSESYNPHVRCGATLALGIACAGTGLQDAVDILEPMTRDSVDFVRQGALISLGMILVEQSEASSPSLASTRALFAKIVSDKHDDPMARFGAALGQGLIDAGGRNVTISLQSRAGSRNTAAIVGMVLFCQFWYWYPLAHCACLAFEPTGIIGLDENLKAPKFDFTSNAKPSLFAYPSAMKPPKKEAVAKVATAVLSTTAKAKAREKRKAAEQGEVSPTDDKKDGDVEMKGAESSTSRHGDVSPISLAEGTPKSRKSEVPSEKLSNFSRVTPAQLAYITFASGSRYQPVRVVSTRPPPSTKTPKTASSLALAVERYAGGGGILIMADTRPEEDAEYIEFETQPVPQAAPGVAAHSTPPMTPGRHIALDENAPEAPLPEAFERLEPYTIICAMRERTKFTATLLDRLPNLKLIATTGPYNRGIDVAYAKTKGVVVSGTGGKGNSTLEHIWALILATVRYITVEDARVKASATPWQATVPMGLSGRVLGLVGAGRLGAATAKIAKAFDMEVVAWSPNLTPGRAAEAGVEFVATKEELFARSDVVSVHMVLSDKTCRMITASDFAAMKPTAFFINTSRGPLVDEPAMIEALKAGKFAGAGLDVFEEEPLPLEHPLRKLANVTLSPHTGYVSDSNYEVFWGDTVQNIAAFLEGHPTRVVG